MSLVKINWHPKPKELRAFGWTVLGGFLAIGILAFLKNPKAAYRIWICGAVVGGMGLTGTRAGLPFYWAWMGIAFVMGNIMSRVLMFAIFFLVVTPLSLIGRIFGRDRLQLRKPSVPSYWMDIKPHKTGSQSYERQF